MHMHAPIPRTKSADCLQYEGAVTWRLDKGVLAEVLSRSGSSCLVSKL
jgi:hypothetical protein